MKKYIALVAAMLLVGCQTFYSSVVSVTEIRKSVIDELGVLYRAGQITPNTDRKIAELDSQFKAAARVMELSLKAYKAGVTTEDPAKFLLQVKEPVYALIDVLAPFVGKIVASQYQGKLSNATQL